MKRFERGDRWCEVGESRHALFEGEPCYEIHGRGDLELYLGSAVPLYVQRAADGGWTVGYRPTDDDFAEYAAKMARVWI